MRSPHEASLHSRLRGGPDMSRIKETLKRPARAAGLLPLVWMRARLDDLEQDVAECRRHDVALEVEVRRIEAGVALVAQRRQSGRDEDHPRS